MPAGEIFVDIYADHGCSYAPSCLTCPFEVCRYDRGFAGNRVSKAQDRVKRDDEILAMRASGMQVEHIAKACGVSGRTVARILSRHGPSRADVRIVKEHDTDVKEVKKAKRNAHQSSLDASGVKSRAPWPEITPGDDQVPVRRVYSSVP